jgi:creatinine amidohydrolase/Fe(II)-dependent formamide hydrolase-like protein
MVRSQNRASQNAAANDAERQAIAQFPEIEKLIESEDFDRINKSFTAAYEELEHQSKGKGGMGKSRDAKKAMKAIERVMDLLRELLKTKYQMQQGGER